MRLAGGVLAALVALAPWAAPSAASADDDPAAAWAALEEAGRPGALDRTAWDRRFEELVLLGEPAALHGLATFDGADLAGRRARARLVRVAGGPACVAGAIERLGTRDVETRLALVRFLGRRDLGAAGGPERVDALARAARDDLDGDVRAAAVEGLARVAHPSAIDRLDALLEEVPALDRVVVAQALVDLADARRHVSRRVQQAFGAPGKGTRGSGAEPLDPRSLAVLLNEYGDVLAQLPGGGESARERRPLVLGRVDPFPIVRYAARTALDGLLGRLAEIGDLERAERVTAALVEEGLDPRDLAFRRAMLALTAGTDPAVAERAASEILGATRFAEDVDGRRWRARGLFLLAGARVASGDAAGLEEARAALDEAARVVEGLFGERFDLMPVEGDPALAGADAAVGFLQWRALVELWRAFLELLDGNDPGSGPVAAPLRRMHVMLLEAQLLGITTRSRMPTESMSVVLADPLGPVALVLSNPDAPVFPRERALDLQVELGTAIAGVAAYEMPGFEVPTSREAWYEPLADPQRRRLLLRMRDARIETIPREVQEELDRPRPDAERLQDLRVERLILLEERRSSTADPDSTEGGDELLERRYPSQLALDLSYALRADDSPVEARALAERMHADLLAQAARGRGTLNEWLVARIEVSVGSSYMDERRPADAEAEFLRAAGRLEGLEESLRERLAEAGGDDLGLESLIAQTRTRRADALLSLAVNANVRKGDPELALEYFEQAFELSQTDFMRVLLACYRARGGKDEEARAVLAEVVPSPSLYYNLACTHALLGDVELALDFLGRDLNENHGSNRSRRRQAEWAREDPDLASLRGNPRFEALLAR